MAGGTLTGTLMPGGGVPVRYVYPGEMHGSTPTNGGISATDPWMYEARVRVLFSEDGREAGSFTMWNSAHRFQMVFTETGVRVYRGAAFNHMDYACDIGQWHV